MYKTSTASIQSIDTVTGIPFCFGELLISFACDLELLRATKTAWDFFGVNFWSRDFLGVLLEALGIFLGLELLAPFDHPRHLKSRVPPPSPLGAPPMTTKTCVLYPHQGYCVVLHQGSYPFSETNFQDFSRTFPGPRLIFQGFTLTPTLPRSQC